MEYFSIICRPIPFLYKVNFSKLDLIFAEKCETNVQPSKNVIIITISTQKNQYFVFILFNLWLCFK